MVVPGRINLKWRERGVGEGEKEGSVLTDGPRTRWMVKVLTMMKRGVVIVVVVVKEEKPPEKVIINKEKK